MPRRVKNSPPLKIKDVAEQIEKHISVLENLVADNNTSPIVDDAIKRRCFVREIANLGEALKGFRYNNSPRHNNNPLLELQSIEVSNTFKKLPKNEGEAVDNSLINGFKNFRNRLLHDYLIQHHQGNEALLKEAVNFFSENYSNLKQAITTLKNKPDVKGGATCVIRTGKAPDDSLNYTARDYASLAKLEIEEMEAKLTQLDILKKDNFIDQDMYEFRVSVDNNLTPAILNYFENIYSLLKLYNQNLAKKPQLKENEILTGRAFLNSNPDRNKFAFNILNKPHDKRKHIAHDFSESMDTKNFRNTVLDLVKIKNQHLSNVINELEKCNIRSTLHSSNSQISSYPLPTTVSSTTASSSHTNVLSMLNQAQQQAVPGNVNAVDQQTHLALEGGKEVSNIANNRVEESKKQPRDYDEETPGYKRPKPAPSRWTNNVDEKSSTNDSKMSKEGLGNNTSNQSGLS